jgi:glycosyltransferase involved in cell wall biosynthesis
MRRSFFTRAPATNCCLNVIDTPMSLLLRRWRRASAYLTLRLGKPIIASDIPAFREVAGDLPRYFEPGNPTALVTAIMTMLSEKQSQPNVLPVWLTWDESAGQLMNKIDEFNAKANPARA